MDCVLCIVIRISYKLSIDYPIVIGVEVDDRIFDVESPGLKQNETRFVRSDTRCLDTNKMKGMLFEDS